MFNYNVKIECKQSSVAVFSKMLRKKDDRRKKGELTDEQVNEIKEAFVLFDTDGSGARAR